MRWRGCCMIAPPNRGSAVARRLRSAGFPLSGIFRTFYGQAGASQHWHGPWYSAWLSQTILRRLLCWLVREQRDSMTATSCIASAMLQMPQCLAVPALLNALVHL